MEKHLICVLFSKCLYVTSQLAVVSFLKKKNLFGCQFCTFLFGGFHPPFLEDPLKLGQIGCGLSVNCELQVSVQIFHSDFQALAGPLRVSQSLVPKPLVLAECFG